MKKHFITNYQMIILIFCLISSVYLSGCKQDPKQEFVGKWHTTDGLDVEFFKDGTVLWANTSGSYDMISNDRMKMTWALGFGSTYRVSFNDNHEKLFLDNETYNKEYELRKDKE